MGSAKGPAYVRPQPTNVPPAYRAGDHRRKHPRRSEWNGCRHLVDGRRPERLALPRGRPGNNARVASGISDPGSLEVAWSCDCGGHIAVVDETVYLRADDGSVHAYEAADGSQLWQTDDFGADRTPAVADGTVYVGGEALTAVDAENGEIRWRVELEYSDGIRSPKVADGVVFVVGDGVLYAFDASSGEEQWQFDPDDGELHESPVPVDDGAVFVVDETRLYAREASDGAERWTFDLEANDDDGQFSAVTPVVDYGILAAGYHGESDAGLSYHDVESGDRIARVAGRAHNHPPVIGSGSSTPSTGRTTTPRRATISRRGRRSGNRTRPAKGPVHSSSTKSTSMPVSRVIQNRQTKTRGPGCAFSRSTPGTAPSSGRETPRRY
ncbi:PQQ-binding-like beta-propeller repeat protein [Saliphagus sp. GCM10025308]